MKTLRYILLLFIFICPVLKAQDIPAWYRTTTELNIRKKPSVHSPIIYRVPKGEGTIRHSIFLCKVLQQSENQWLSCL